MSDLMREEFEQFIEENGLARACSGSTDDQRGISAFWFIWQKSWKASRECFVIELPKPFAVIGDYADCGGGRTVWDAEFSEKITDRMCKKTAVYDKTIFEALGLKVKS